MDGVFFVKNKGEMVGWGGIFSILAVGKWMMISGSLTNSGTLYGFFYKYKLVSRYYIKDDCKIPNCRNYI